MLALHRHTYHHLYANMQTTRKRKRRRDKNSLHHRDHLVDCSLLLCKFNVVCAHPKPKEWTEANDANGKFFFRADIELVIFVSCYWYICLDYMVLLPSLLYMKVRCRRIRHVEFYLPIFFVGQFMPDDISKQMNFKAPLLCLIKYSNTTFY